MRSVDIQTLLDAGKLGDLTDGELLGRFVNRSDAAGGDAFAVLVERHGPMVWGVCRRLLPDRDAAADAVQATFLVLIRKAAVVRVEDSLGPWLYGVSRRVAARARAVAVRQQARESGGVEAVPGPAPDPDRAECRAILDDEIGRLPERQRAVVVLCDLQGLPHAEVALQLGCPVGTVESRLARGRQRLRDRLVRRGLAPAAAALWTETARATAAAPPAALVKHLARWVTGSPAAGTVPMAVNALAEGVIQMMGLARLKSPVAVAAALFLATTGGAVAFQVSQTSEPSRVRSQSPPPRATDVATVAVAVPDPAVNRALARQQLALIDEILTAQRELVRSARMELTDASFALLGRQRLEMLRKAGAEKAEIVAALEKYISSLTEDEAIAKALVESARAHHIAILDVQYRRREAEMWLNEEKAR